MADDVTVSNNSGNVGTDYTVATDEVAVGGNPIGQVQFVKLVDGTLNGTTPIPGSANGLKVDPSSVTSPVSAASLPLPLGAATEATIASILAKFPGAALVQGHGTAAAALRVELPTDGTGVVGLNAGANVIGALTANQSVNAAQVAGTTTDTNSGNKSAGTQRFVIATDQPQLTNALKVDGSAVIQPVSGTVTTTPPANASTNVTQFGSNNVATGTGVGGVGIPRVTVSSDSFPASVAVTGPLTDGQLRATPVPVSGTVTTTNLSVGTDGSTTEPSVNLAGGWDGLNLRSAKVQNRNGDNSLFVVNPELTRLLELLLIETQAQSAAMGVPGPTVLTAPTAKPDPIINGAVKSVTSATTVQTLAPASVNRSGLAIYNNSTSVLYVLAATLGTVSSTLFTVILQTNDYWEAPQGVGGCYKGSITGVWAAANGTAMITEWSA